MPELNFYLKSTKADKKGFIPIIAQISSDYKKYRKTVDKTKKKYWNPKKQRVRPSRINEEYNKHIEINSRLNAYEAKARDYFTECLKQDIQINEQVIKGYLAGKPVLRKKIPPFFVAFDEFIESKKIDRAKWTIKGYNTVLKFLEDFQHDMEVDINFQTIDLAFYDQLKNYAFKYRDTKDNYFAKITAVLKNFLNWSEARKYINDTTYKRFSFSEKEIEVIYLNLDELLHLNKFEFEKERHSKARDLYCFACFTGLRYSDIKQLRHDHIQNNTILKKIQKTQAFGTIPLNDFALKILKKYKDYPVSALPKLSEQKANDYIKEACELAGINTPTMKTENRAGKSIENVFPKYKLITMHTGRKTFVTNSLILKMNLKAIKGVTGHKRDSSFERYLKIAEDYKKTEMDNAWNKIGK